MLNDFVYDGAQLLSAHCLSLQFAIEEREKRDRIAFCTVTVLVRAGTALQKEPKMSECDDQAKPLMEEEVDAMQGGDDSRVEEEMSEEQQSHDNGNSLKNT